MNIVLILPGGTWQRMNSKLKQMDENNVEGL